MFRLFHGCVPLFILGFAPLVSALPVAATGHPTALGGVDEDELECPENVEIEGYRTRLIETAFEAVRRYPNVPHRKNQARIIDELVRAALELDQPELALRMIPSASNWRRGSGYAHYSEYCAEHGFDDAARKYAQIALEVVESEGMTEGQKWRADQVRSFVGRTWVRLGEVERALAAEAGYESSERGRLREVIAEVDQQETPESAVAETRELLLTGDFDILKNSYPALGDLYREWCANAEAREAILGFVEGDERVPLPLDDEGNVIEQRDDAQLRSTWVAMPIDIRVETLAELSVAASECGQGEAALTLAKRCDTIVEVGGRTRAEIYTGMLASMALAYWKAGDVDQATRCAVEALFAFEEDYELTPSMYRAESLRPLAEAQWRMGLDDQARATYARVLEEGAVNANSRPRGDDLAQTMISMAKLEFEPTPEMWERIEQIADRVFAD